MTLSQFNGLTSRSGLFLHPTTRRSRGRGKLCEKKDRCIVNSAALVYDNDSQVGVQWLTYLVLFVASPHTPTQLLPFDDAIAASTTF